MRPRTPTFIWIPFVFSIGTLSWAILGVSLAILAVIVIAPAAKEVKDAQAKYNNVQATLDLQDKALALRDEFIAKAGNDAELMQRLASLKLGIEKKGEETLVLHPGQSSNDPSVQRLLADALPEVKPAQVKPLPEYLAPALHGPTRMLLLMIACGGLVASFVLGVRFDRGVGRA